MKQNKNEKRTHQQYTKNKDSDWMQPNFKNC